MNKKDFFDKCASFDWFFKNTENSEYYRKGRLNEDILLTNSNSNVELKKIYDDWFNYSHSGKLFNTEKLPKPKFEDYE